MISFNHTIKLLILFRAQFEHLGARSGPGAATPSPKDAAEGLGAASRGSGWLLEDFPKAQ